jgi:uncharacterized membrane protein YedE/YeeE
LSDKAIGCSTAYARTSGMIERIFGGNKVYKKDYYKKFKPKIDWEWMLVLGIIIGAFISSIISNSFSLEFIPSLWQRTFGSSIFLRIILSLVGGIFVGFGARMAGGCTSGHGISGNLQLSIGSYIATFFFFVGGIITAVIIYSLIGGL